MQKLAQVEEILRGGHNHIIEKLLIIGGNENYFIFRE